MKERFLHVGVGEVGRVGYLAPGQAVKLIFDLPSATPSREPEDVALASRLLEELEEQARLFREADRVVSEARKMVNRWPWIFRGWQLASSSETTKKVWPCR